MSEIALYQSVLQKIGQISPKDLLPLDVFLTNLMNQKNRAKPAKGLGEKTVTSLSPIYWLEQLAQSTAFSHIENPVEWQRQMRQDQPLAR